MPAAAAGNSTAAHALVKLVAAEAALVPSMAAPVMGGGLVSIQVDWLQGNRLSYADADTVSSATLPALEAQETAIPALVGPWKPPDPLSLASAARAGRKSVEKLADLW